MSVIMGGYRRGTQLRTTSLGTWCAAVGPDRRSAGVLVLDDAVDVDAIVPLTRRLKDLGLPGVVAIHDLLACSGQHWLIVATSPGPTLADLVRSGHGDADSVVALAHDTAAALLGMHRRGLAHGNFGADSVILDGRGVATLLDWSASVGAPSTTADDVREWARLIWSIARDWCAEDFTLGVSLARVADAAVDGGLVAAVDQLDRFASRPPRRWLAEASALWLTAHGLPPAAGVFIPRQRNTESPRPGTPAAPALSLLTHPSPTLLVDLPPPITTTRSAVAVPAVTRSVPERSTTAPGAAVPIATPSVQVLRYRDNEDLARLSVRAAMLARRRRALRLSLAVVLGAALLTLAIPLITATGNSALEVRSVSVGLERAGSTCTVVATIVTNGRPGTLAYRWVGDTPPVTLRVQTLREGQQTVRVSQRWEGARPTADPAVMTASLELAQPAPRWPQIQLGPDCR